MSNRPVIRTALVKLLIPCASIVLQVTPACAFQVMEQMEKMSDDHHGGHHMNISMGEETCAPKYTYEDGPLGPDHWKGMCTTGRMQAPIDIQHAVTQKADRLEIGYKPVDLDIINDCNQYRLLVRFPDNNWLKVGKKPYFLSELHFRQPAENAVDGKRAPLSIQFVHLSPESTFLIIEVPVVVGKENPAMKALLDHVPAAGKEQKVAVKINPMDFLPADRNFYRFPGSLTDFPFCNEGVTWYRMKTPIEFSAAQIAAYEKYYRNSARPLQPLNDRPVIENQAGPTS